MTEQYTPPHPPFRLDSLATVKHLGIRKEGPEDDKIIAADVKLEIKGLDRRLCRYFDDAIEAFLWRGDTDALIVRNDFLHPIGYANVIEDAIIKIGTLEFIGDAKKFFITPCDGGVITLALSVAHAAFDPLWQGRAMSRKQAYAWLAKQLGIQQDAVHISEFDVAQCGRVVEACEKFNRGELA